MGPREPEHVTRPTPVRRRHDLRVRTAPPYPRDHAGTFGVRVGPTSAAPRSPPALGHPPGPHAEPPARHTGAVVVAPKPAHRSLRGPRTGANTPPTPIEFLIAMWRAFASLNGVLGVASMTGAVALTLWSLWLYLRRYGAQVMRGPVRVG